MKRPSPLCPTHTADPTAVAIGCPCNDDDLRGYYCQLNTDGKHEPGRGRERLECVWCDAKLAGTTRPYVFKAREFGDFWVLLWQGERFGFVSWEAAIRAAEYPGELLDLAIADEDGRP